MPTTRPRHVLTETDELSAALRAAAVHWPEDADQPSKLLRRLIETGHRVLTQADEQERRRRAEVIERTAGSMSGVYPPGYLEKLRAEWPD